MDHEIQQELAAIVGELSELTDAFARAETASQVETEGADSRGAVSVRLDASGRLVAFRPNAQWRSRVPAAELGAAIAEAVQAASISRLERWAEALGEPDGAPPPAPPRLTPSSDLAVDLTGLTEEVFARFEALDRTPGDLVEGSSHDGTSAEDTSASVTAGTSRVQITLSPAGVPTAVRIDPSWVGGANLTRLAEEVPAAFAAAYAELDAAASAPDTAGPAPMSAAMAAVARDPGGMLLRFAQTLGADLPSDDTDSRDPGRH